MKGLRFGLTAAAVALAAPAVAGGPVWEGARLLRIEPSSHPAAVSGVQLPLLFYEAIAPTRAGDGSVWIHDRHGYVRHLVPYIGDAGRWHVPGGLEAPSLAMPDGTRLALDREGVLWSFTPDAPGQITRVADALPVAVGQPCLAGAHTFWPDSDGGVAVLGSNGVVAQRFQGELFRARRTRGGGVVACDGGSALVAVAGGRIALVENGQVRWADTPRETAGAEFAPRAVKVGDVWVVCARESRCVAVNRERGEIVAALGAGSFDGPAAVDEQAALLAIAGSDGRLRVLDSQLRERWSADIGAKTLWSIVGSGSAAATAGPLWVAATNGDVFRVTPGDNGVQRVYSIPSGLTAGGRLLPDGTALLLSNFGALHVFAFR